MVRHRASVTDSIQVSGSWSLHNVSAFACFLSDDVVDMVLMESGTVYSFALCCLQHGLQQSVMDDFKMLLGTSDVKLTSDNIERLTNACLVVNALGPKVTCSPHC